MFKRCVAVLLMAAMLMGVVPTVAHAAPVCYNEEIHTDFGTLDDDAFWLMVYGYVQLDEESTWYFAFLFQHPDFYSLLQAYKAGLGAIVGTAIANHWNLTGWRRGLVIGGGTAMVAVAGWFAGPAVVNVASQAIAGAVTTGNLALTSMPAWIVGALNLGKRFAPQAIEGVQNFTIKAKYLMGATGDWARFATNSTTQINQWITQGLGTANNFTVNSADSFSTIVNMGQIIGAKGEQFLKIVFTTAGRIITAYPVHGG